MRTILIILIDIFILGSSFSQSVSLTTPSVYTNKNKDCFLGSCTLELKPDKTFILKEDIKVFNYGKYSISKDTLILHQTHIRDYYGHDTYGFDSSYLPHKAISRFVIKGDTLILFFHGGYFNGKLSTLISKTDTTCSLILTNKKN